jgi:RNA polymerase subunit RPABC4/transcription elongation factor Spt4
MKIWKINVHVVTSKKQPDLWENWANYDVVADTISLAIEKAIEFQKKDFYKVRVDRAELISEVDIE